MKYIWQCSFLLGLGTAGDTCYVASYVDNPAVPGTLKGVAGFGASPGGLGSYAPFLSFGVEAGQKYIVSVVVTGAATNLGTLSWQEVTIGNI